MHPFAISDSRKLRRTDIQALRGIAVIAVVLFHYFESFFVNGFLGVDVFFVISGYVVTPLMIRILVPDNNMNLLKRLRHFWIRRFQRLAPALTSTLIGSSILIFLIGDPSDHVKFAKQGLATLLLIGNLGAYFFAGDYFAPTPNPLIHTWSLSVEEQVYFFVPILLVLVYLVNQILKKPFRNQNLCIFILLTIISIFLFLTDYSQIAADKLNLNLTSNFFYYFTPARLFEFTLGSVASLLRTTEFQRGLNRYFSFILKSLFLIILLLPFDLSAKISVIAVCLVTVFLIHFELFQFNKIFHFLLCWFGDRSYSIYLVHVPIFYLAKYSPIFSTFHDNSNFVLQFIVIFILLVVANLQYRFIEKKYWTVARDIKLDSRVIVSALAKNLLIPFLVLIIIFTGSQNRYWGFDKNVPQPAAGWDHDFGCKQISKNPRICSFDEYQSSKKILLIGDSHAYQYTESFLGVLRSNQLNGAISTQGGCLLQVDVDLLKDPTQKTCISSNRKLLKWIESYKPSAIIVSQFVHSFSSQLEIRNFLALLRSISPQILLIENNPVFPDGSFFMKSRPLIFPSSTPPKLFPVSEMLTIDVGASNELALWARNNGITTLNADSIFCDTYFCSRFSNSQWLYWDDDHLSAFGAALIAPKISEFVQGI